MFALELGRAIRRRFWDDEQSTLHFTAEGADDLPIRPENLQEQSTPSSTGVALEMLAALDHFDPAADFEGMAEAVRDTHAEKIDAHPERNGTLARLPTG